MLNLQFYSLLDETDYPSSKGESRWGSDIHKCVPRSVQVHSAVRVEACVRKVNHLVSKRITNDSVSWQHITLIIDSPLWPSHTCQESTAHCTIAGRATNLPYPDVSTMHTRARRWKCHPSNGTRCVVWSVHCPGPSPQSLPLPCLLPQVKWVTPWGRPWSSSRTNCHRQSTWC